MYYLFVAKGDREKLKEALVARNIRYDAPLFNSRGKVCAAFYEGEELDRLVSELNSRDIDYDLEV